MDRMSMIEIGDVLDPAKVAVAPPVIPVALNPDHVTRQAAALQAANEAGIVWPETILPPGTPLYSSGVEKLTADRKRWGRLPFASQGLPVVKAALVAEDRRDFQAPAYTLRLNDAGRLVRVNDLGKKAGIGYDRHSFTQLTRQIPDLARGPRGYASSLLYLDHDLRAEVFNRAAGRAMQANDQGEITVAGPEVTIRTKLTTNGVRVMRACLSEKYADVTDVDVADALSLAMNGDAQHARLDYRPGDAHSQFEVIYPSEIPVPIFRVGDVHKAVMLIENSETGRGSIRVRAGLVRVLCANLTLASGYGVEVEIKSIRHAGSAERVKGLLRSAMAQAAAQIQPLVQTIVTSAQVALPDGKSPGDIFAAIARKYEVPAAVAQDWRETYEGKYATFGANLWSVTSAITESAQRAESWWQQQGQEEVASELLAKQWGALAKAA